MEVRELMQGADPGKYVIGPSPDVGVIVIVLLAVVEPTMGSIRHSNFLLAFMS